LIEGNDDENMIKKIIKSVNFPFMKRKLSTLYKDFVEKELKCDPFEDSWKKIKMALKDLTYFD
jgi:hypothetical protein